MEFFDEEIKRVQCEFSKVEEVNDSKTAVSAQPNHRESSYAAVSVDGKSVRTKIRLFEFLINIFDMTELPLEQRILLRDRVRMLHRPGASVSEVPSIVKKSVDTTFLA